ncbi:MAG: undecaprenyl-diphosphatase UppP [Chloroflexota bacterium]|nr:MAG: undecaprenyl-diphosphatase UppP [Chloroflexota bacterium]
MTYIEAIILGIVQGATEFLPISSSGHLILIPNIFDLDEPNLNAIAIAHQGTLLAVLVYFRHDLWRIVKAVFAGLRARRPLSETDSRLGWYIAAGSIPAVFVGLFFADAIDRVLAKPETAAAALIVTGIILIIGEQLVTGIKGLAQMGWADALIIGFAQAAALIPGISRSGITITAGLGRGLNRETAARYSFLLGVPAIAGAGLLAAVELAQSPTASEQAPQLLVTFLTAAIVGYACIHFLLTWLRERSLYLFAAYCIVFGVLYLLISWLR